YPKLVERSLGCCLALRCPLEVMAQDQHQCLIQNRGALPPLPFVKFRCITTPVILPHSLTFQANDAFAWAPHPARSCGLCCRCCRAVRNDGSRHGLYARSPRADVESRSDAISSSGSSTLTSTT